MTRRFCLIVTAATACSALSGCPRSSSESSGGAPAGEPGPAASDGEPEPGKAPAASPEPEEAPPSPADTSEPEPAAADGGAAAEAERAPGEGSAPASEAAEAGSAPTIPSGGVEIVEREGLRITRLVLARNVEEREPVGAGARFSAADGGRVYAFIEVENPERTEAELTIAWSRAGDSEERGSTTVQVGATPRYRTWAFTSVTRHSGAMLAIVRDAEGNLLARAPFEITE